MPSVGMRRTTRVFGARVLRSGRRLCTPGEEVKRAKHGNEWIELLDNVGRDGGGGGATKYKENGWLKKDSALKQETNQEMDIDVESKATAEPEALIISPNSNSFRRWGTVYTRKRRRHESGKGDTVTESKRFGKHFVRKKRVRAAYAKDSDKSEEGQLSTGIVIVNTSCGSNYWVSCLLSCVLRYLRKSTVSLQQIFGFINSKPLRDVSSLHGILLLQDQTPRKLNTGACFIAGGTCSIPVFALDFSTVPCCFMYLHSSMLLRFIHMSYALVMYSTVLVEETNVASEKEMVSCLVPVYNQPGLDVSASGMYDDSREIAVVHPTVGVPKLAAHHLQLRNSSGIQKRRSSLSSRRGRRSCFGSQDVIGALASDRLRLRRNGLRFSSRTSRYELRSSGQKISTPSIKELKSALVELTQDIDATSCSANILVIESDKCYRQEGATIAMELSGSKQWILAVKVGGVRRFNLTAEKVMRPCSANRVTHDIIWVGDRGWKLEFPDRRDWLIFKELYKECSDRNVQPPALNIIPVPGVREVSGYAESNPAQFARPDSYITVRDDELTRALARSTACYDMDSDDDEWLENINDELFSENKHLSVESFEILIDTFEKGFYCNPDDYSDEKAAINSCLDKEKKEIVEAVYSYWSKKRKQKRSSLIRIFQCYQPRRTQVIPKSILRKKRSFKRQGSQAGRGKHRPFLQAMVSEKDTLQRQNSVLKVQEAKAAADKSEDLAVRLRQRAQQLMENADLATYKAAMALKIAEAAKIAKSTKGVAPFFIG
ncbi:PREDICTED: uncharacterized protein LOC109228665 [Nicotiana attenuata]|uniref:Enhancer of polycomb-like protein n=1 Tax=Nicotiana attenuata TaxID=49451 RepID=A0A1J6I4Y5_NICAT|nr:PREDICTED: uncharacterized protein LOC109228665 [Nicotiana attenuata]XP_019249371.1 PREDICTED: uncharacterized protein LOC109228665 [Nicotiana attenuata]OIT00094.1 hypothetical protein A4A49_12136 [Nicotiana attenuata]